MDSRSRRRASIVAVLAVAGLFLGPPSPANACAMASHHWRILLGSSDRGLVVLDLPLKRVEEPSGKGGKRGAGPGRFEGFDEVVSWKGAAVLGVLPKGDHRLHEVTALASIKCGGSTGAVAAKVRGIWPKALQEAGKLPGWKAVGMPSYRPCDYGRGCGSLRLQASGKGQLSIAVGAGQADAVSYPVHLGKDEAEDGFVSDLLGRRRRETWTAHEITRLTAIFAVCFVSL
jgi:hypothetical protein